MSAYQDNVAGITTSTGLSTLIVNASDPRFKSFSGLSTGTGYCYRIEMLADNSVWQTGRFSWNSATSTATITSTKTSSSGGSAINWAAGQKLFMLTADSELLRDMAEMVESTDALILTAAERDKLATAGFGVDGADGAPGDAGADGSNGADGADGADGSTGPQGIQGIQGIQGVTGDTGPQGDGGATGSAGADGADGSDGADGGTGATGATGAQGVKGDDGDQGIQGIQGIQGVKGDDGDQGIQGIQGIKGDDGDTGATGPAGDDSPAQTDAQIKTAYENNADTNAFDDAAVAAVIANTAKTGVTDEISNVVEDTTPELGGDLDAARKNITNIRKLNVVGQSTVYSVAPGPFIEITGSHSYSYVYFVGTLLPPAVYFGGTHTLNISGFPFGMGQLFLTNATIKNNPSVVANFSKFVTLQASITYQADTQSISMSAGNDAVFSPIFSAINGGSLAAADYSHTQAEITLNTGTTMVSRVGHRIKNATGAGALTSQAGIVVEPLTKGVNNTGILIGTAIPPSGNFGVYQQDTNPSRWNGGQRFRTRQATTTTVTVTASDGTVEMSNTGTVTCTLPSATTCEGLLLTLIKTGASGTLNIASVSGQTSKGTNRTATPWVFTAQWTVLQIQSNGTNWTTLINEVPA